MPVILIVCGTILFLLYTIAVHRFYFMEGIQRKARKMTPKELRILRDYSRSLVSERASRKQSDPAHGAGTGSARAR